MRNHSLRNLSAPRPAKFGSSYCFMGLLLTGATGFLGRNILLRALSEGTEVLTAVRNADKLLQQLRFEKKNPQEIQVAFRAARSLAKDLSALRDFGRRGPLRAKSQ